VFGHFVSLLFICFLGIECVVGGWLANVCNV
jgi:hypothetical protein